MSEVLPGMTLTADTPATSRPSRDALTQEQFDAGLAPARQRLSVDGQTAWCNCCDTCVAGRAQLCNACDTRRRAMLRSRRDRLSRDPDREDTMVPIAVLDQLVERCTELFTPLSVATIKFNNSNGRPPQWVDDLMLAAKALASVIEGDVRPLSSYGRRPEADRRPNVTPAVGEREPLQPVQRGHTPTSDPVVRRIP